MHLRFRYWYAMLLIKRETALHLKTMTINQVRELLYAERVAKDIYFAANKTRTATKAQYEAMVAATKARQAAMTAYAATVA
jgi:hypothetical protein